MQPQDSLTAMRDNWEAAQAIHGDLIPEPAVFFAHWAAAGVSHSEQARQASRLWGVEITPRTVGNIQARLATV